MAVFWVVAPCILVEALRLLKVPAASIIRAMSHRPDDGGSKHLWNVGKLLLNYTEQRPCRKPCLHLICCQFIRECNSDLSSCYIWTLQQVRRFCSSWSLVMGQSEAQHPTRVLSKLDKPQLQDVSLEQARETHAPLFACGTPPMSHVARLSAATDLSVLIDLSLQMHVNKLFVYRCFIFQLNLTETRFNAIHISVCLWKNRRIKKTRPGISKSGRLQFSPHKRQSPDVSKPLSTDAVTPGADRAPLSSLRNETTNSRGRTRSSRNFHCTTATIKTDRPGNCVRGEVNIMHLLTRGSVGTVFCHPYVRRRDL
jgi:hypothetical protein